MAGVHARLLRDLLDHLDPVINGVRELASSPADACPPLTKEEFNALFLSGEGVLVDPKQLMGWVQQYLVDEGRRRECARRFVSRWDALPAPAPEVPSTAEVAHRAPTANRRAPVGPESAPAGASDGLPAPGTPFQAQLYTVDVTTADKKRKRDREDEDEEASAQAPPAKAQRLAEDEDGHIVLTAGNTLTRATPVGLRGPLTGGPTDTKGKQRLSKLGAESK